MLGNVSQTSTNQMLSTELSLQN